MTLTNKQLLFCKEYLIDFNATQAAIRAGYSKKTAQQIGAENLLKPVIAEYINKEIEHRSRRTEITADYVLGSIQRIAQKCEHTDQQAVAIKGYELLGKHLKLFTDKLDLGGGFTITEALAGIDEPDTNEIGEDETEGNQE